MSYVNEERKEEREKRKEKEEREREKGKRKTANFLLSNLVFLNRVLMSEGGPNPKPLTKNSG